MENMRKRMLFLLATFMCAITSCMADKPIAYSEVSAEAKSFVEKYFPEAKVAFVESYYGVLGDSYEIIFNTGDKLKISESGEWREIKSASLDIPDELIPETSKAYLDDNFPGVKVKKIEKSKKFFGVDLVNKFEIKFNHKGAVIELDD
jgi:hypothetical protein